MANLSMNDNRYSAYALDLCFDLDDALTMPENVGRYDRSSSTTLSSESTKTTNCGNAMVANLPTVAAVEGTICPICAEGFQDEEEEEEESCGVGGRGKQLSCGHIYHETCIAMWLSNSNSCPLCRSTITPQH